MNYYSDPTAAAAIGNINREFSRLEKEAKKLLKLYEEGKLSEEELKKSKSRFSGLYRHVLDNVMSERKKED